MSAVYWSQIHSHADGALCKPPLEYLFVSWIDVLDSGGSKQMLHRFDTAKQRSSLL